MRLTFVVLIILLAGCTTPATTPTPTPTEPQEVVDREVTTGTVSLDGLPVSQTFRFQNGAVRMDFPIQVEFQRPNGTNWTTAHLFNVGHMEWFTVKLIGGKHYRIVIEDAEGERRSMGLYEPVKRGVEYTIVIGGCCVDDFSGGNDGS